MGIFIQIYLLISTIGFAISKTATTLNSLSITAMKWLMFPVIFISAMIYFFIIRKKFRWYRKYWYVFGFDLFIYYMIYRDHDA